MNKVFLYIFLLITVGLFATEYEFITYEYKPYLDGKGNGILETILFSAIGRDSIQIKKYSIAKAMSTLEYRYPNKFAIVGSLIYDELGLSDNYEYIPLINLSTIYIYNSSFNPQFINYPTNETEIVIGCLRGVTKPKPLLSHFSLIEVNNFESGIHMLKHGRIDILFGLESSLGSLSSFKRMQHILHIAEWSRVPLDSGIVVHKENRELYDQLYKGLIKLRENGESKAIIESFKLKFQIGDIIKLE